ncbi:MAG TPA: hypothetical protein VLQ45_34825 [Thermoanaerobaculia bacterium]|nr:hypothetical protein [Thermoanaerobaculia bacterium]
MNRNRRYSLLVLAFLPWILPIPLHAKGPIPIEVRIEIDPKYWGPQTTERVRADGGQLLLDSLRLSPGSQQVSQDVPVPYPVAFWNFTTSRARYALVVKLVRANANSLHPDGTELEISVREEGRPFLDAPWRVQLKKVGFPGSDEAPERIRDTTMKFLEDRWLDLLKVLKDNVPLAGDLHWAKHSSGIVLPLDSPAYDRLAASKFQVEYSPTGKYPAAWNGKTEPYPREDYNALVVETAVVVKGKGLKPEFLFLEEYDICAYSGEAKQKIAPKGKL